MHTDEVDIDAALVDRLVRSQFPHWAGRPLLPMPSSGTANASYRLGGDLVVRLPRIPGAAAEVAKEQRWLPVLAPRLPLPIPKPVAQGVPGHGYPWNWSVYRWLDGEPATAERIQNPIQAALDLAAFILALQQVDPRDGSPAGPDNWFRGVSLASLDDRVRGAIPEVDGVLDTATVTRAWERALESPRWDREPVWIHGDLQEGNLLATGGRLSGVIDFGCLGVGDPACDVMAAWSYLAPEARGAFRSALSVDDMTWERGRGWALYMGLLALPYYRITNPAFAEVARNMGEKVLADQPGAS